MIKKADPSVLSKLLPELDIYVYDEIDSTNLEARRLAEKKLVRPSLILSSFQSAGKGRQGKSFYSPKNTGLYMSLLYPLSGAVYDVVRITAKTSCAVVKGLTPFVKGDLYIKWVNDIYFEERKVCGILVESVTDTDNLNLKALIIGIGINLNTEDFPEDIRQTAGSLHLKDADLNLVAAGILRELLFEVDHLQDTTYLKTYRERSNVLGKEIYFLEDGEKIYAKALRIDDKGGLVVGLSDGTEKTLDSGEISVRVRS